MYKLLYFVQLVSEPTKPNESNIESIFMEAENSMSHKYILSNFHSNCYS